MTPEEDNAEWTAYLQAEVEALRTELLATIEWAKGKPEVHLTPARWGIGFDFDPVDPHAITVSPVATSTYQGCYVCLASAMTLRRAELGGGNIVDTGLRSILSYEYDSMADEELTPLNVSPYGIIRYMISIEESDWLEAVMHAFDEDPQPKMQFGQQYQQIYNMVKELRPLALATNEGKEG